MSTFGMRVERYPKSLRASLFLVIVTPKELNISSKRYYSRWRRDSTGYDSQYRPVSPARIEVSGRNNVRGRTSPHLATVHIYTSSLYPSSQKSSQTYTSRLHSLQKSATRTLHLSSPSPQNPDTPTCRIQVSSPQNITLNMLCPSSYHSRFPRLTSPFQAFHLSPFPCCLHLRASNSGFLLPFSVS